MIRKLMLYAVLIGVVVLGSPYLTGMLVESKFEDVTQVLSQVDSLPLAITVTEYKRGWRKSYAKTNVTFSFKDANGERQTMTVPVDHEIRHGPFVQVTDGNLKDWDFARALIHSKIMMSEDLKQLLSTVLGQNDLIQINSEIFIHGAVEITVNGNPIQLKQHEGTERVAWKGVEGTINLNSDLDEMKFNGKMPGLDFDFAGMSYDSDFLTYQSELNKVDSGLWPGKFILTMNKLVLKDTVDSFNMRMDHFSSGGLMAIDNGLANFSGQMKIEKLTLNQKEYGPIVMSNSLRSVDEKVVKSFFEISRKLKLAGGGNFKEKAQLYNVLLPELLKTRPEFSIDELVITTAQGKIDARLNVAVGGPEAYDLRQMPTVLKSMVANAYFSIPKETFRTMLVEQDMRTTPVTTVAPQASGDIPSIAGVQPAPAQAAPQGTLSSEQRVLNKISTWVGQGWLLEKGDHYTTQISYTQGKLTINGKVVENPLLFLALM